MSVWLCLPSKRPASVAVPLLRQWKERGYRIIVQRDLHDSGHEFYDVVDGLIERPYVGYPEAATHLIHHAMGIDKKAEWFVCAGDDITPDPHKTADEIGRECCEHFAKKNYGEYVRAFIDLSTFGVMQPTGDRWGEGERGPGKESEAHIDCIAGSPWIGREFARRMYGGDGPYWTEYFHMFDDEELQNVATMLGVFWQRKDITHYQRHGGKAPDFLKRAYSIENWHKNKAIFTARKAAGFPGHEPIP